MNWTQSDIDKKLLCGKIAAASTRPDQVKVEKKVNIVKISHEKQHMNFILEDFCKKNGFDLEIEFKFFPSRQFRSDWAVKEIKLLIEYEGLFSRKSRHTTLTGFSNDTLKYNMAVKAGYDVLRYTAKTYKNLYDDLSSILKRKHVKSICKTKK